MNKPIYLYVDDENDSSVDAVAAGLKDQQQIEVKLKEPKDFKSQRDEFIKGLNDYDGLILDLRLDQNMKLDVSYNAPAIAQELRTIVANPEYNLRPCPIILCSTNERMRATYDADKTSHDLFDYKFLKGSEPNWNKISKKLCSLANGYKWLRENEGTIKEVFNRSDLTGIDSRITEHFEDPEAKLTVYNYAYFVLKDLFHHPGPLIKERILAARLGIDIESSDKAWINLRDDVLVKYKYTGLFGDGWDRWWANEILIFFKEISGGKRLASLEAKDRVQIIANATKIDGLNAATPIPYCSSSNYWTICEQSKMPLDPLEGFKVHESSTLKGWQEPKYLSFNAIAAEGIPKDRGLRPHPSELKRIQLMKEHFSK